MNISMGGKLSHAILEKALFLIVKSLIAYKYVFELFQSFSWYSVFADIVWINS